MSLDQRRDTAKKLRDRALLLETDPDGKRLQVLGREIRDLGDELCSNGSVPVGGDAEGQVPIERLNAAVRTIGGNVEFVRVRQVGLQKARWYVTVRSRQTRQPVELKSLTTHQLRRLSNLSELIFEARAGELPTPNRGTDRYERFMAPFLAAAEFEEHGATEAGSWRRRLAVYLSGQLGEGDLESPSGKVDAIEHPAPRVDPDGRLWVHAGAWLEYLETRRMDADDADVRSALRQLDFEPRQLTAKVGGEARARWYWRSKEPYDWREEEA
jgi:hypothetical protein